MKKIFNLISLFIRFILKFLSACVTIVSALFLLSGLAMILILLLYHPETEIPDGSALVLAPRGSIVEQKSPLDPMSRLINNMAGAPLHFSTTTKDSILNLLHIVWPNANMCY